MFLLYNVKQNCCILHLNDDIMNACHLAGVVNLCGRCGLLSEMLTSKRQYYNFTYKYCLSTTWVQQQSIEDQNLCKFRKIIIYIIAGCNWKPIISWYYASGSLPANRKILIHKKGKTVNSQNFGPQNLRAIRYSQVSGWMWWKWLPSLSSWLLSPIQIMRLLPISRIIYWPVKGTIYQ